jgi:succinoglycan biosynthesis protein ExoM
MSSGVDACPVVDVCIATYRRPQLLGKLLESLAKQETDGRFSWTINICDNDASGSGREIVDRFGSRGFTCRYVIEPEKNISLARNRSIALGTGEFIATVDDDEVADPRWLHACFDALNRFGADVVHGRVLRLFPPGCELVARSGALDQPCPEQGARAGYVYQTANSMFRRDLFRRLAPGFDPAYGISGSGDTEFFLRARAAGAVMIFTPDALTTEYVHRERATALWLLKRGFREGINSARIWVVHEPRYVLRDYRPRWKRLTTTLRELPRATLRMRREPDGFYPRVRRIGFEAGFFAYFLGFKYEEYR